MSIVYDYLKRIQDQKESPRSVPNQPSFIVRKTKAFPFWLLGSLIGIGVLILGAAYWIVAQGRGTASVSLYRPQTALPAKVVASDAGYVLEGIIYNPDRPFAIINGQMLERNGQIDDYVVTSITPSTVSLKNTKDNTGRTLQL